MTTSLKLALSMALAAGMALAWTAAGAQDSPPPADQTPQTALQVENGGKHPIVAVYSSPPGLADWSDDIVGKAALKPGQSRKVTLKAKPKTCKVDVIAMQDNGDTVTKRDVDMCAAAPAVGF